MAHVTTLRVCVCVSPLGSRGRCSKCLKDSVLFMSLQSVKQGILFIHDLP